MGRPAKSYKQKPADRGEQAILLTMAFEILWERHRVLVKQMRLGGLDDAERVEFVQVESFLQRRERWIEAKSEPIPRNQKREKKWIPGMKTPFRDPAPMKNPRVQQDVLRKPIPLARFASDNPIGNAEPDELPSIPCGSNMIDEDRPPWE